MKTIEEGIHHCIRCLKYLSNYPPYEPTSVEYGFIQGVAFAEEWISVEEELPPTLPYKGGIIENEDLLLLKHGQFQSLEFGVLRDSKKGKFWELPDRGVFKLKEITHWRPINRK